MQFKKVLDKMSQFILTAKQGINRPNGFHIDKGTQLVINIPIMGIQPGNFFGNPRTKDFILTQFRAQGMNIPPSDQAFYSRGNWDVKKI